MDSIQNRKFKELTDEQNKVINYYCSDEMKELKKVCNPILSLKGITTTDADYHELLSRAMDTLVESLVRYDGESSQFKTFLIGNIKRTFYDFTRDSRRAKRCNIEKDENGKIPKDENGKPIIVVIPNVPLDAPITEDGDDLKDTIKSDFDMEKELAERSGVLSERISEYVGVLGSVQRKIADLIMNGYDSTEIKSMLNLSDKTYAKYLHDMKDYQKSKLLKEDTDYENVCDYEEETLMDGVTTTSEKTKNTSYAIDAISKKLKKHRLRDDHVLQRASGQWNLITKSELVSDILQGKALTQIIISEEVKNGITMHWLIDGKQRCTNINDFLNDGFAISKNVQVHDICYQSDKVDEDGNVIYNEDGFPIPENKVFDIRNKKFSQLPDELQDKFKEYQVPVMLNLNCTKKDIAYDIARFNRCRPMNISQNGFLGLEETFAEYVDNILKMDFFKIDSNKTSYTASNNKSGALRRMVVEAIITSKFIDNYDKNFRKMCDYLTENANESVFIDFYAAIERLTSVAKEESAMLFNIKNSYLWLALFENFTKLNVPDEKFSEFMIEFVKTLHSKSVNGITYDELEENKTTKDRSMTKKKMTHLYTLMLEYLHIEEENPITEDVEVVEEVSEPESTENNKTETIEEFVSDCVDIDVSEITEDMDFYNQSLDDVLEAIENEDSKLLQDSNRPSLLAMVVWSYKEDFDLEDWMKEYSKKNNTYFMDQKKNFNFMLDDFKHYDSEVKSA